MIMGVFSLQNLSLLQESESDWQINCNGKFSFISPQSLKWSKRAVQVNVGKFNNSEISVSAATLQSAGESWTLLAGSSPVNPNKSSLPAKCIS